MMEERTVFTLVSVARQFQNKKRKEGYGTRMVKHAGISQPYCEIFIKRKMIGRKEITRLVREGKTNDEIYEIGISSYSLYGQAFFGFKSTKAEKQKMNRLWARILSTGELDAKTRPKNIGNYH